MAELSPDEKNRISHRAEAMRHALPLINQQLQRDSRHPEPSATTEEVR
jgi:hypothetical protein